MGRKKDAAHSKVWCYVMTIRGVVWTRGSCQSYEELRARPAVGPPNDPPRMVPRHPRAGWPAHVDFVYMHIFVNGPRVKVFSDDQHHFSTWNLSYRYHLTTYPPTMVSKSAKACANSKASSRKSASHATTRANKTGDIPLQSRVMVRMGTVSRRKIWGN